MRVLQQADTWFIEPITIQAHENGTVVESVAFVL